MGSRRGADGRGHRPATSGQDGGRGAERLGAGLGRRGRPLYGGVQRAPRTDRLARALPRRHPPSLPVLSSAETWRSPRSSGRPGPAARAATSSNSSPEILPTTALAALLATGAQGGYYAITTWLPTYLKTVRGLSVFNTGGYLGVVIAGCSAATWSAWLSDSLAASATSISSRSARWPRSWSTRWFPSATTPCLSSASRWGSSPAESSAGWAPSSPSCSPPGSAVLGQGFSYNFGRGVGAFPTLVALLAKTMPLGPAIGIFAASAYAVLFVAAVMLPETRGRELAALG